jgi:hypothetical protein
MIAHLLGAVSMLRLPRRPDRVEPRAIKHDQSHIAYS